jgi:hypothetical protein
LLELASRMIEELTQELTRQQGELAEKESALAGVVAELDATEKRLQSALAEVEQIQADRDRQTVQDAESVGDALVSAHRAGGKIVAEARRSAESVLEAARENAAMIQREANYVIEQAEIRALGLTEQAAADVEALQAESVELRATILRERQVWASFLRRALAAVGDVPARPDDEGAQQAAPDLEGDLRSGIRPAEPGQIGPGDARR